MSIMRNRAALVGVGATDYYKRGASLPRTPMQMACEAILLAAADAGISPRELDGFTYFSGGMDTGAFALSLGVHEVRFSATVTGGGNGSAGVVGLAASAVVAEQAEYVVSVFALQQATARLGAAFANESGPYARSANAEDDFIGPYGLFSPGQRFAMITQRHMALYGTRREHFGEVAISQRANAIRRPNSLRREPLTMEQYLESRMICDPLCLLDHTMESDGAVALITTSAERARDLQRPPVYIRATASGGDGRWGRGIETMGMAEDIFASSGAASVASDLYRRADATPGDVDVALLYDHFAPMVLMQLEDYGFCGRGESGPFVGDGNVAWPTGSIPVNTHGGNLSDVYIGGMTHLLEAVEQMRGTAVNQVADARLALVTGGPSIIPQTAVLLGASA